MWYVSIHLGKETRNWKVHDPHPTSRGNTCGGKKCRIYAFFKKSFPGYRYVEMMTKEVSTKFINIRYGKALRVMEKKKIDNLW